MRNAALHRFAPPAIVLALGLLAGCAGTPPAPPAPAQPLAALPPPPAHGDTLGILAYAVSLQGAPYRSGGESPATGFDCSGFVRHVYAALGLDLPRNTAAMAAALPAVPAGERRAGDLVFFNTTGGAYSHVGIYLGDDRFVHAPSQRTGRVMVSDIKQSYWQPRFTAVRRPFASAALLSRKD